MAAAGSGDPMMTEFANQLASFEALDPDAQKTQLCSSLGQLKSTVASILDQEVKGVFDQISQFICVLVNFAISAANRITNMQTVATKIRTRQSST